MTHEHFDVLIVGVRPFGHRRGYHLQANCPGKSYVILEGRDSSGGTWDLFRYPGIRSDSDMYTLGYSFKPWTEAKAIADGPSILKYRARNRARQRHRPPHPLRSHGEERVMVERGRNLDRGSGNGPGEGAQALHLQLPFHVLRLLRLRQGLHA